MASKGELDSVSGRKIPKNLVSKDFWRNYSLKDLITAFLPALVFTFITSQGEERFKFVGFSLSSLFFFLGLFALYICPRHLSMYEWVFKRLIHFISFPSKIRNVEKDEFSSRKGFTDSSRAKFFETDLRTQDLVRIKRFYPLYNCVEKRNGSLVGGIKVEPANMTYKPPEKWRKNVNRLTDILNNYMDSDIQIFCSKRQIPVESQLNLLEKRFLEKDVSRNEVLRSLIEEQLERYPEKAFSTNIQEFYVLVTVSEKEMGKIGGKNWGFFLKIKKALKGKIFSQNGENGLKLNRKMFKELRRKIDRLKRQIDKIEGCSAKSLTTDEYAKILAEFWRGEDLGQVEFSRILKNKGAVK